MMNLLLKMLFYPFPKLTISKEEEIRFTHLYQIALQTPDKLIHYNLPIPKYKFLYYLAMKKPIIFHGSNNKTIDCFEPRDQTQYNSKLVNAVFATKDPIWPVFFATLQKEKIIGDIRNASLSADRDKAFHFYSLTKETLANQPWDSGMIYILPKEPFTYLGEGSIQFNEWISHDSVLPLAKLEVNPSDFFFYNKVATHRSGESILKSWLLYKLRTR